MAIGLAKDYTNSSSKDNEFKLKTAVGQVVSDSSHLTKQNITARVKAFSSARIAASYVYGLQYEYPAVPAPSSGTEDEQKIRTHNFKTPSQLAGRSLSTISFVALQEWEGFVEDISDEFVYARLKDVRDTTPYETELAEIPLIEFSDADRLRIRRGSIFRWAIGLQKRGSTSARVSSIVLRHLPAWTSKEIDAAALKGTELSEKLRKAQSGDPSPARRD